MLEAAHCLGVRKLDTAYNYFGYQSHRTLRAIADDLLPDFSISTKVGYFRDDIGRTAHCLHPARLVGWAEQAANDLGQVPDVLLLHNPERSLDGLPTREAGLALVVAIVAVREAVRSGLARRWGISTWAPGTIQRAIRGYEHEVPRPDVLMVRAGLLVNDATLAAAEQLRDVLGAVETWGMSPFAGAQGEPVWETINPSMFIAEGQEFTPVQAAFRVAADIPRVSRLVVGTDDGDHLRELVNATALRTNPKVIAAYRRLLADRQQASASTL